MELFKVGKALCRCLKAGLLPIDGFPKKLLRANLLRSLRAISKCRFTLGKVNLPGALFFTLGGPRETSMKIGVFLNVKGSLGTD